MRRCLTLLMFTLVVTGATSAARADELSLWHSYRGDERAAIEQLVRGWNEAHPEHRVKVLAVPHSVYPDKLTTSIPRGQGPDVFVFAHERIGDWCRSRLILPLTDRLSAADREHLPGATLEAFTYEGELYGVPLASKSVALFVNRDLVQRVPTTTDELVEIAERLSDPDAGRFGLVYEAGSFYHHAGWLHGFGGAVLDRDGAPTLNRPENATSMAFARDLTARGLVPQEPTGALVTQLFNDGQAAMAINGPWFLGEIDDDVRYEVVPLPLVSETGEAARPFLTVEGALISSEAAEPDVALELARYLALDEGARVRLAVGQQLVADERAFAPGDGSEIPRSLLSFKEQAARAEPMPNHPLMRAVWEPAARALRSVLRGGASPEAALAKAQLQLEAINRPPPKERSKTPYVAVLIALLAVGAFLIYRRWRGRRLAGEIGATKSAYGFLLPALLAITALVLVPFAVGTAVAFFTHRAGEFTFVGVENFVDILLTGDYAVTDPLSFWFTLAVTVLWTALNVLLHVTIGLFLAMVLRHPWLKLRGIYRVLLIVPWAIPNYITALIWKGMFHSQLGSINALLEALGLEPVSWFSQFWTSFAANVSTNTWLGFPFMMVVCLGALQALPRELEEAAAMDGASGFTRFRRVILPLIKPALLPAVVLGSVWTFNMFNVIYLVSAGEPDGSTEILISEAYRWAFSRGERYGYAAAYAVLIFVALYGYSRFTRRIASTRGAA
jgi:arabinogalactan oligomer/maltooligosaccharide transport system permease protein